MSRQKNIRRNTCKIAQNAKHKIKEEDHYEKIKLIGQGTFGKVFLVLDKRNQKVYAMKEVIQDKKYKNRQLSIISQITQCNIIALLDYQVFYDQDNCLLRIIMEKMPTCLCEILKERRKLKRPLEPKVRKVLLFQLFKGLYYLQSNNICHRDLKPANILINDSTFQLKICDFGSAKVIEVKQNNVSYICSRYYRAPELLLASTTYGTEIDMWSAGCIAVELMTSDPIFPGDSTLEQMIEIIKILGTPPKELMNVLEQETGIDITLPTIKPADWKKILKKYQPQDELIQLIKGLLTYNVQERLTAQQILKHPYFSDLPSITEFVEKLPHLLDFSDLQNRKNRKFINELKKMYTSDPQIQDNKQNEPYSIEKHPQKILLLK